MRRLENIYRAYPFEGLIHSHAKMGIFVPSYTCSPYDICMAIFIELYFECEDFPFLL